jgi:LysW-gamma-L-alpha-aminoadipyl-6-phosphate/LysW-L-glutamyl-5-phosphate reductase
MTAQFTAGVYGATGYIGAELLRRLLIHPEVRVTRVCADDHIGLGLSAAQPHLEGWSDLKYETIPERDVDPPDVLFLALPHQVSWRVVQSLAHTKTRIIDCSGAFRLRDAAVYAQHYGQAHPHPDLLQQFVYGLPEVNRAALGGARYVASPGCFATCIELGLLPLAKAGVLSGVVSTVGITGSSGAGSVALQTTHHPSRAGNLRVYKPLSHPHAPEIESLLTAAGARALQLNFVPVASPLVRGILATSMVRVTRHVAQAELDAWTDACYAESKFTRRPKSRLPEVVAVAGSNFAEVGLVAGPVVSGEQTLTCVSALDNLMKGGAGQAIQNMNLMLGLDETLGLWDPGGYP